MTYNVLWWIKVDIYDALDLRHVHGTVDFNIS